MVLVALKAALLTLIIIMVLDGLTILLTALNIRILAYMEQIMATPPGFAGRINEAEDSFQYQTILGLKASMLKLAALV